MNKKERIELAWKMVERVVTDNSGNIEDGVAETRTENFVL